MSQREVDDNEIQDAEQAFAPEEDIKDVERVMEGQRSATEDEIKEAEKE